MVPQAAFSTAPWRAEPVEGEESWDILDADDSPVARVHNPYEHLGDRDDLVEQARAETTGNALLAAAAPDLRDALKAAKRALWDTARHQWTLADFKNWAVVQQIDAALSKADGEAR